MNKVRKLQRENNIFSFMHCTNYEFPANNNVVFIQLLFDKLCFSCCKICRLRNLLDILSRWSAYTTQVGLQTGCNTNKVATKKINVPLILGSKLILTNMSSKHKIKFRGDIGSLIPFRTFNLKTFRDKPILHLILY